MTMETKKEKSLIASVWDGLVHDRFFPGNSSTYDSPNMHIFS